ncbi:hypothetical protein [Phyllobacterium zundukense]|uniref:DUF2125 domain-containing protein n=1 Tax=Phyllobacterium zundukense TaxID=1867719 RepID=A0A2N9W4A9_9HYPH|nr:hypothetical protein [Phyllobacterium zundukense]ATU91954.1 hypothetical protein BLM14_10175 [Phyllobacterium zundukense]PIO46577.1 hypothetical protein B5P45_01905 [Phyllobacterium zundukense]
MRRLVLISCMMIATTPVFAQTIDAEGAKKLAETLSKYVGKTAIEKNIVNVVPERDSYRVTFSTGKLLESLPKQDYFKGDFGEYSLLAKPLADGTWNVSSTMMPAGSVEVTAPTGPESIQWSVDNANMNGIFDPKIGALSKASFSYGSFKMKSTSPTQDVEASANSAKGEMIGSPAATGGIDFSNIQTAADFQETMVIKSPPSADDTATDGSSVASAPADPLKVVVRGKELGVNTEGKGFRNLELLDLWAFFIAHSEEKTLKDPDQAELKTKLLAALPLWNKLSGAYRFTDMDVETPLGPFTAKNISQELNFDGISKSGGYHYALRSNGLKYPVLPIPEWSVAFLPTDVELAFGATGIDLDTVAKAAIADMDLNREKPFSDEFEASTAAAFMMNPPKVVINKSLIRTADTELTVEGEVSFTALKPESRTTWEMTGFDAALDRLTKASEQEPEIKDYIVFAKLAKDFGTQLPNGHIQWIVDQKADGSVNINGNPVKGPDPVVEPGSDGALDGGATLDNNVIVPDDEEDNQTAPAQ